jgi:hypothetical protein
MTKEGGTIFVGIIFTANSLPKQCPFAYFYVASTSQKPILGPQFGVV